MIITRRNILVGGAAGLLTGCDALGRNEDFRKLLALGEKGNFAIQRSLQDRLAEMILAGDVLDGATVRVTAGVDGLMVGGRVSQSGRERPQTASLH